jgi:2'-hydroxyisoflavone reductase
MPVSRRRFAQVLSALPWLTACRRDGGTPTTTPGDASPSTTPPPAKKPEAPKSPTLLILGGTGFLGPHIVDAARARGWTVTLFNRGKTAPEKFPDIETLLGDRDGKLDALRGRKWDAVIDTSGYVPRIVKDSATLLADNVGQYVFVSSISAYAEFATVNITETHPVATMPDPTVERVMEFYGALKALCEQAAEAALPGRVTNVRPGFIVGPGDPTDRFTYWPVRMSQGGNVLAPGAPGDPIQFIDVRDLAEWIVGAVERKHMGVYNVCGPAKPKPMGEFLAECQAATPGVESSITWVDVPFLEAQKVQIGADLPIWAPAEGEYAGFARINSDKAVATGLKFRDSTTTIADTLTWFASLPEPRRKTLRAGWLPAREAEVLAAFAAKGTKTPKGPKTSKGSKTSKGKLAPGKAKDASASAG